jgi:DNA-binding NtrC family response regulator
LASGGTLFLDEITEMPVGLQAKLLRVLQEGVIEKVGGNAATPVDLRVVAATNRDPQQSVEAGLLRRDLYFRLNVITLRLPALRSRAEDIPDLVDHFLRRYGRGHEMSADAMQALLSYEWPGNVRQLEHCIQHMVAVNSGPVLHVRDLPTMLLNHMSQPASDILAAASAVGYSASPAPNSFASPIIPLPELEKRAIIEAMRYTKGDRTMAASLLGIGRTTLYRKLKDYGVEAADLQ